MSHGLDVIAMIEPEKHEKHKAQLIHIGDTDYKTTDFKWNVMIYFCLE